MRTAAMSVLAARHLARPDARSMALIGLGAQSEFQAVAFHALPGIEELVVYDVDPAATDKFRRNPDARDLRVRVAASEIGRAHVSTPVTHAHTVCRLLLEK